MKKILLIVCLALLCQSCYVHQYTYGDGAQVGIEATKKQHNFLGGLVSGTTPDVKELANGEDNFEVTQKFTFIDYLISSVTFGIWNPTTIKVVR
jgi:hypothetical protein